MRNHFLSILRSPLGYAFNFIATVSQYIPLPGGRFICWGCETFTAQDGIQNDPLF